MKSRTKIILRWVAFAAAAAIMIFIFFMSAQDATQSSATSGALIRALAPVINGNFNNLSVGEQSDFIASLQHFVRKAAHFSIYTALGFSLSVGMFTLGIAKTVYKAIFSFIIGVLYAVSDEIHQLFVPGRSGELRDVLIDSGGVLLGILILSAIYWIYKRKKTCK